MEETGCKIICGVPVTLAVKGLMIMMIADDDDLFENAGYLQNIWHEAYMIGLTWLTPPPKCF